MPYEEYPRDLGTCLIPISWNRQVNKTTICRGILKQLENDTARMYEFDTDHDARTYRSMLYTEATMQWGPGSIGTRIMGNVLYVWSTFEESEEK